MFSGGLVQKEQTGNLTRLVKKDCPYQIIDINSFQEVEVSDLPQEAPSTQKLLEPPCQARIRSLMNS